ncbi:hypothetical protein MAR_010612 [Mya arenaria]|uniref:Uncharacterized protein n=1 Tax=Mya arenaria TaxID=6604 RepID=A0ABY7E6K6_MYAAR|nr:hypothetical protein MAR_010612 [Mya arenaria]
MERIEEGEVVCEDNRYTKPTVVYTGEDAGSKMIECLLKEEKQIREILSHIKPMDISEKEREDIISKANYCCICKKAFTFYDRTMENVRRYKAIEIIHTKKRLDKVTAKPTYKDTTILNEDLVAVELYKSTVNLVKPIYCGMSILGTYGGGARSTKVQLKRVRSDGKTVTIHSDLLNGAVLKIKRYLGMTKNDSGIHPDLSCENVNVFNDQLIGYRICRTQTKLYRTPIKLDFQVNLVQ